MLISFIFCHQPVMILCYPPYWGNVLFLLPTSTTENNHVVENIAGLKCIHFFEFEVFGWIAWWSIKCL